MPKEYVEGQYVFYEDEKQETPPDLSVVCIRWSREASDVQIVTRLREAEVPHPNEQPIPAKYGWHVDLDRAGINDLIRILRRARDQAFGRDE